MYSRQLGREGGLVGTGTEHGICHRRRDGFSPGWEMRELRSIFMVNFSALNSGVSALKFCIWYAIFLFYSKTNADMFRVHGCRSATEEVGGGLVQFSLDRVAVSVPVGDVTMCKDDVLRRRILTINRSILTSWPSSLSPCQPSVAS